MRGLVCEDLGFLGISIDARANAIARGGHPNISAAGSRVATLVVPTDEERMIALDTMGLTTASPDHALPFAMAAQ
ncbi:hypothetical protein [Rhodobacter viridis]|uniref:hypothetical protein n=1 Tax=Rhodobacter viridis TaxID=1054202 RepID=UPI001FE49DDB